jgi:adenylate cyclase
VLKSTPQLANIYLADPNGDFLMLQRRPDGAVDTKRIDAGGGARRTTWTRRDPEGHVLRQEDDPGDSYDARRRPWYRGAAAGEGMFWTEVYVFFTDRKPGITAALPMRAADGGLAAVLGVDIDLKTLSSFLAGLEIGTHGRAMIIDGAGKLVAFPDLPRMLRQQGDELVTVRLDELGDPVLDQVYDRLRIAGHGRRSFKVGGVRWIAAASAVHAVAGRGWTLLIVVPEEDFVGFLVNNGQRALAMSAGVVLIAALLAALLARQGLRADRQAGLVLERERALGAQSGAFAELAASAQLFDSDEEAGPRQVTEIVARAVEARRVSLWRFSPMGDVLACVDCFDRDTAGHTAGTELARNELPQAFAWLAAGQEVELADAAADPQTAELHRLYLHPVGCSALLSVPIRAPDRVLGAVWIEDEAPPPSDRASFARAVAGMLAVRFAGSRASAAAPTISKPRQRSGNDRVVAGAKALRSAAFGDRGEALMRRFAARGGTLAAEVFPDTTVLAIRFTDHLTLAEHPRDGEPNGMLDRLARALEVIAARQGIGYLKILGDQVIAAEGLGSEADHAELLAEMALEIQEGGARLFAAIDRRVAFRIGLDTGSAIGSSVGEGGHAYNLWGEAVRTAAAMAE